MTENMADPLVVWVIHDNKPGHLNQSLGLAEALARATPTTTYRLPAQASWRAWLAALFKLAPNSNLPKPDLILAAGHATHFSLLAARRTHGFITPMAGCAGKIRTTAPIGKPATMTATVA